METIKRHGWWVAAIVLIAVWYYNPGNIMKR